MIKHLQWDQLEGRRGLYHAAVTRLTAQTRLCEHTQDFFEFFVVSEGAGLHYLNGKKYPLRPGRVAVVGPKDRHTFAALPGQTLSFINVAVSSRWWESFQVVFGAEARWEQNGRNSGHFDLAESERKHLHPLLLGLMSPGQIDAALLIDVWASILSTARARRDEMNPTRRPPVWLMDLRRDLSLIEWMAEPISFWQKRSGRSAEHLARSCRKFYGAPPTELINRERIERVKFLLQTGDDKITTAAFAAGFNNMAHFYRVFQRLTGKSPRRWREQAMRSAVPVRES